MANDNDKFKSPTQSWLNGNILLSLSLYFSTYIVLGWLIASQAVFWLDLLHQVNIPVREFLEEELALLSIKLLALVVMIIITFILSSPVALTTFLFEGSINTDFKGFVSILLWSIILVFAFCFLDYFVHLLVIIAANILLRLDLRKLKYRNWQIILSTLFCSSIAFCSGMILFELFSDHS